MKRIVLSLLAPLLLCAVSIPNPAHAVLITVNFSVGGDPSDPVNGSLTGTGSFSFDSIIIPSGGGILFDNTTGLGLSALSFTWDGHTWSELDADAYNLGFNSGGNLVFWNIGGAPVNFAQLSALVYPDFVLAGAAGGGGGIFSYTTANSPDRGEGIYTGSVASWSIASAPPPVAEPGTLSLLGMGLLPLGLIRRRSK